MKQNNKKYIRIALINGGGIFIKEILDKYYNVIIDYKNPEYVLCGPFFQGHKGVDKINPYKYSKAIRIFSTGESISPDFNIYDYAIGFDNIKMYERYFRYPVWADSYNKELSKQYINKTEEELLNRKFCNFIYSNNNAPAIRNNLFKEISKYKQVDSWGKVLNNMGMLSPNKLYTQSQYKFSIACENALYYGYTTEKIIYPFIARSVPIYWGNPDIASEFNEKAFINVHNFKTLEELTKYIKSIDEDDNKYIDMLNEGLTILPPPKES